MLLKTYVGRVFEYEFAFLLRHSRKILICNSSAIFCNDRVKCLSRALSEEMIHLTQKLAIGLTKTTLAYYV